MVNVEALDSLDAERLALLRRPELGITFTKLFAWALTQYRKYALCFLTYYLLLVARAGPPLFSVPTRDPFCRFSANPGGKVCAQELICDHSFVAERLAESEADSRILPPVYVRPPPAIPITPAHTLTYTHTPISLWEPYQGRLPGCGHTGASQRGRALRPR